MSVGPEPADKRARASQVLKVRKIWLIPVLIAAVFVALMSAIYFGSVVNPTGHLHGLPVVIVNQDTGANVHGQRVDVGAGIARGLERSTAVNSRLGFDDTTLVAAKASMDRGGAYATLVIPATLTRSVLVATGATNVGTNVPAKAIVELLENSRLGSLGVGLAAGVITPAISKISRQISTKLKPLATPSASADPIAAAQLADPVALETSTYRPLPDHSALGLSAFYVALLAIMSGFLASTLINSSIDSALGYGATEFGPRWRQRRPVPIDRRQTLLIKWVVALIAAPVVTGILLLVSAGLLNMYAPNILLLWLLTAFAAIMIASGTLTLLAVFGTIGQLLALILLVYLSLASSGGTVPVEALPGVFKAVAHVEPLRQVLLGTRAIMYFDARGDAGLRHSLILIGSELAFWMIIGFGVTTWYDHRKLYRIGADLFPLLTKAIDQTVAARAASASTAVDDRVTPDLAVATTSPPGEDPHV
jgi:YhgE/Pip-like protein